MYVSVLHTDCMINKLKTSMMTVLVVLSLKVFEILDSSGISTSISSSSSSSDPEDSELSSV